MKKIKIIVADDQEIILNSLIENLKKIDNFEIIGTAKDGKELLSLLEIENTDVLITDNQMPELSGLEVLKKYKESKKRLPLTYVISGDAIIADCLSLGVNFFSKPINTTKLISTIQDDAQNLLDNPKLDVNTDSLVLPKESFFKKIIKKIKLFIFSKE